MSEAPSHSTSPVRTFAHVELGKRKDSNKSKPFVMVSNWRLEPATNAPTHPKNRRQLTTVSFNTTGQLHVETIKLWTTKFLGHLFGLIRLQTPGLESGSCRCTQVPIGVGDGLGVVGDQCTFLGFDPGITIFHVTPHPLTIDVKETRDRRHRSGCTVLPLLKRPRRFFWCPTREQTATKEHIVNRIGQTLQASRLEPACRSRSGHDPSGTKPKFDKNRVEKPWSQRQNL